MIGRLEKTVIDCPEPRELAAFYCAVLGMRVNEDNADWVVIGEEPGLRRLAFQRTNVWNPPEYHNPQKPQQLHIDIRVDDVEAAEEAILKLGATRLKGMRETGFRVYADPVGHPFCLVFGHTRATRPDIATGSAVAGDLPAEPAAASADPATPAAPTEDWPTAGADATAGDLAPARGGGVAA